MKTHEILQKMWKQENPSLSESGFHIIGFDRLNPWGGSSYQLCGDDISHLTSLGVSILATPHIGLHWPSNNMYPHMGVTICDYMGNQSVRDTADEPETIFEGGSKHYCAIQHDAVLSPYLQLSSEKVLSNGFISARQFAQCSNLGHVHHIAKKKALGYQNVILDADLLDFPFVRDFFKIIITNQEYILQGYETGIFNRIVSPMGCVTKISPATSFDVIDSFLEMKKSHKYMIEKDVVLEIGGYLPIKESLIMLDAITCYWQQVQRGIAEPSVLVGDTFTVSGIDMIHYLKGKPIRNVFSRMFEVLQNSGTFPWLPKHLRHTIVPGGLFRFLPSCAERELRNSVRSLLDISTEKGFLNTRIAESKNRYPTIFPQGLIHQNKILSQKMVSVRTEYVSELESRRGFSQYDLLNGERVPADLLTKLMPMSFEKIQQLFHVHK
ncbi:MAG: hypothetical protein K9M36_00600 [Candidatus Pacebacteria bacterium]|nr:hypothetical protein [Candidatus Paceibacterota bacterium]